MKQTKFIFAHQLIAVLTITALLLPSISSAVVGIPPSVPYPVVAPTPDPKPTVNIPFNPNDSFPPTPPNSTAINPADNFNPPIPPGGSASKDQLAKWREADQIRCEAEANGKKTPTLGQLAAGAVTKPFKDAINEKIGMEALPASVDYTDPAILESTSQEIEKELQIEIQEGIKDGLREELPKTLAQKLADDWAEAKSRGVTEEVWRTQGRFEGLIEASVRETWPKVLNKDFINRSAIRASERGLRSSLKNNLRLNFNQVGKTTIEEYYGVQIDAMLKQIPDMVKEQVETLRDTIQGTQAGLEQLKTQAAECWTTPLCAVTRGVTVFLTGDIMQAFPEIKQAELLIKNLIAQIEGIAEFLDWLKGLNKEQLVKDMIDGLTTQLITEMTQPNNIEKLADAIGGAISGPINRSLEQSIDKVMDAFIDPVNAVVGAVNNIDDAFLDPIVKAFDLQLNTAIAQITVPVTAMIDRVGIEMAASIDSTLGEAFYPFAAGITANATGFGNFIGDGITTVGFGLQDLIFQPPPLIIVDRDLNIEESLAPNAIYRDDYEAMQSLGWTVVHDDLGRPTGPGEIRYSDYLAEIGSNDDGSLAGALPPTWSAVDGIASDSAEGVQNATEQVTNDAMGKQMPIGADGKPGFASSIAGNLYTGTGKMFTASIGALFEGIPYVGPILAQLVEQLLNEAMFGTTAANVAGGLPVMDIGVRGTAIGILTATQGVGRTSGKILSTEKQTTELTQKLLNLQIQSCTNLKVMRRIQLMAEEEMFIWTPNARKANSASIFQTMLDYNKFLNEGREISDGMNNVDSGEAPNNKDPLIIGNLPEHINEAGKEAKAVVLEQLTELAKDDPNYSDLKTINKSLATEGSIDELKDTIDPEIMTKFRNEPEKLSNAEFWDTFTELGRNNIYTRKLKVDALIGQRVAEEESAARDEYIAGQGYAGTRECIAQTADGYCAKWQILTPGSTIGAYGEEINASPLHQAETSNGPGSDFIQGEVSLSAERLKNLSDLSEVVDSFSEALKSIFQGKDPCPGPGPCPSTGWKQIDI
jgi:hypothetical protein